MANDSDVLLSTTEVAAQLGWHRAKVERAVRAGTLSPAQRGPGIRGAMLFRPSDVDALATARTAQ
jgi:excisionase family DNA binding protein